MNKEQALNQGLAEENELWEIPEEDDSNAFGWYRWHTGPGIWIVDTFPTPLAIGEYGQLKVPTKTQSWWVGPFKTLEEARSFLDFNEPMVKWNEGFTFLCHTPLLDNNSEQ